MVSVWFDSTQGSNIFSAELSILKQSAVLYSEVLKPKDNEKGKQDRHLGAYYPRTP